MKCLLFGMPRTGREAVALFLKRTFKLDVRIQTNCQLGDEEKYDLLVATVRHPLTWLRSRWVRWDFEHRIGKRKKAPVSWTDYRTDPTNCEDWIRYAWRVRKSVDQLNVDQDPYRCVLIALERFVDDPKKVGLWVADALKDDDYDLDDCVIEKRRVDHGMFLDRFDPKKTVSICGVRAFYDAESLRILRNWMEESTYRSFGYDFPYWIGKDHWKYTEREMLYPSLD